MSDERYVLYRKNDRGEHAPIGRFTSAEDARGHADEDGKARGLVDKPYIWGASYDGMWQSHCPDFDKPSPRPYDCNDYIVIDSGWKPVEPISVFELPPFEIHPGQLPQDDPLPELKEARNLVRRYHLFEI